LSTGRKSAENLFDFRFALAIDEQGNRWSKGKIMLDRTIEANELLPTQSERRSFKGAFRSWLAKSVSLNL
jgi:hypothetical protein